MAKTYLEVHPDCRLLVLDSEQSIGGTWSKERLYEGLRSNNVFGQLEWSDFPMDSETFGVAPGDHIPGTVLHRYLTAYAQRFGVFERTRFMSTVKTAELRDTADWLVTYEVSNVKGLAAERKQLITKKLVMATGTTSKPNLPTIKGMSDFKGHVFHSGEMSSPVRKVEMDEAENVVVLGGSKSAADAVYLNASKGKTVDWVIRASGRGPAWLSTALISPANLLFERLATTRIMTFLSPSFDQDAYPTIRWLLHNTMIGRALLRGLFAIIRQDLITRGKFNENPESQKLIPSANVFWSGTSVGVFNYPTHLFDFMKSGKVRVHREDVMELSQHTVKLSSGKTLATDVLIFCTGWKHTPTVRLLPEIVNAKNGLSGVPSSAPAVIAADIEVMKRWPSLRPQPDHGAAQSELIEREQPAWELYRGMIPPAFLMSRNLAYTGMAPNLRGYLSGEVQALWITAFLDGKLSVPLPSQQEVAAMALLERRFWRYRAPLGLGRYGPDKVFETLPWIDTMMRDLGLNAARKSSQWAELFDWYGVSDYRGLVKEWKSVQTADNSDGVR